MKRKTKQIVAGVLAGAILLPIIFASLSMLSVFGLDLKYTTEDGKTVHVRDFRDTQGHWAQETCYLWADYGVINGVGEANFDPDNYITRKDLACILDRMFGLDMITYNHYYDLDTEDSEGNKFYYVDSLLRCAAYGYIQGEETDSGLAYIMPHDVATREQVATILYRAFEMERKDVRKSRTFTDSGAVSSWASDAVNDMAALGYINGYNDGSFRPQGYITRAEFVTMLSNICGKYFSNINHRTTGDTFVNQEETNEAVAVSSLVQSRSTISGDIYLTHSNTSLKLDNCEVDGTLFVFGDMVEITLSNTHIDKIEAFGQVTLKGATNVDEFIQHEWASGSTLDNIIDTITLAPHTLINIDRGYYENTSNRYKTYDGDEIFQDMADAGMILSMSPSISSGKFTIDSNNDVTANNLKPSNSGTGILKTFGVLINKGTEAPTISSYDAKRSFRESYLESVYEDDITQEQGSLTQKIYNQPENTVYTYVAYAMNTNGLVAYGTPTTLQSYDWTYELKLVDTGEYPESMRVECWLYGDSLPKVNDIQVQYSSSLDYSEKQNWVGLSEDSSVNKADSTKRKYTATVTSTTQTDDEGNKTTYVPKHFGVKITFADETYVYKYPILVNATPTELSPVTKITTGSVSSHTDMALKVTGNTLKSSLDKITEYGIAYSTSNSSDRDTWQKVKVGSFIRDNSTLNYDANLPLLDKTPYTIYYTAYVKNDLGYYYGETNSFSSDDLGDKDGPQITEALKWESVTGTGGILSVAAGNLSYVTIKSFKDNTTGENLSRNLGVYDSTVGDYGDCYSIICNDKFCAKFDNLTKGDSYTVELQCYNSSGAKSDINRVTFVAGDNKIYTAKNENGRVYISGENIEVKNLFCNGEEKEYSDQLGAEISNFDDVVLNLAYKFRDTSVSLWVNFNFTDKLTGVE